MNPILNRKNILDAVRLITHVNERLAKLNETLYQIPGMDPIQMKAKYGTADPLNFHTRFMEVEKAFKLLENKLLHGRNIPEPGLMHSVLTSSVEVFPGRFVHQVEVEFPEYDFRAFLSAQAIGIEDSDVEEGEPTVGAVT